MCWADRATLILGMLWATFHLLLSVPQNPNAFSAEWWEGSLVVIVAPIALLWIVLRLALGSRGAVYHAKPRKPGYLRDAQGNVLRPLRPDTADPSIIDH